MVRTKSLIAAVFTLCISGSVAAQTVGTATITGQVTDSQGGILPGVRVTVVGPGLNTEVITEDSGRFQVDGLLQGAPAAYTIRAELPGFETTTVDGITADLGSVVHVPVTMPVTCLAEVLYVVERLSDRMASADVVALVRVDSSIHQERVTIDGSCSSMTTFAVTVVEPIKNGESGARLRFFQTYTNGAPPRGAEYIALLTWRTDVRMYQLTVPPSLIAVTQGWVAADALREVGVTSDVPLGEALEKLRALIAGR